ncbi:hypothetical protein MASR1M32_22340 [Rhodobacter sp.]
MRPGRTQPLTLTRRVLGSRIAGAAAAIGFGTGAAASTMANPAPVLDPDLRDAALRGLALAGYRGDLPQQLTDQWAQPGLESRAIAIFELPPDEITGGALMLGLPLDPRLEGKLRLAPPADPPRALSEREFP